jgi:hypothetical protein
LRQIQGWVAFQPAIARPGEWVREDTQGLAGVRLFLHPGQGLWPGLVPAAAQRGGFRKGPWEVCVAHRGPRRPQAFAPGCVRTFDEATIRRTILPPGQALKLVHGVEPDEAQDVAQARDGL